jgi:two-component system cell cycle sensor histidine kinase/response regulator CckA
VYGIVAQSGGYIWAESEPEKGSSFKICFPRALSEDAGGAVAEPMAEPSGGSETILLVEDEDAVRALASRVLTEQGYLVLEASNGVEGLNVAEKAGVRIDLVLTDVIMPEMGGRELGTRISRVLPDTRIMYMSGYSEADKLQRGIRDLPDPFLQKPFSPESLVATVRRTLDRERVTPST